MQSQLRARLKALEAEFESGQATLRDLEQKAVFLRERLLMLRGAIDVLHELDADIGSDNKSTSDDNGGTGSAGRDETAESSGPGGNGRAPADAYQA